MRAPEQRFDYGQTRSHTVFSALISTVVAAGFVWGLHFTADGAALSFAMRWGITALVLFAAAYAIVGLFRLNALDDDRRDRLTLTAHGIDYRPRATPGRAVFIAYSSIFSTKLVHTEDDLEFRIKHGAGTLKLKRNWFDDRARFDSFVAAVTARIG